MTEHKSNTQRLLDVETDVATLKAWQRSQVVRNWARAISYVLLMVVCVALTASVVYLVFYYLPDRREAGDVRARSTAYAVCVALQDAPTPASPNVVIARTQLKCDELLHQPPPAPSPNN